MTSPKHKGANVAKGWKVLTPKQVAKGIEAGRFDEGTGWIIAQGEEKIASGAGVDYDLQIGVDYDGQITILLMVDHMGDHAEVVLEHKHK